MDTRNNNDDNLCTDDCDQESGVKDEESAKTEKWKKHYSSKHKILLVGEGDFSFSLCLARAFGSAHNLVATSLDSHGQPHLTSFSLLPLFSPMEVERFNLGSFPSHPFHNLFVFVFVFAGDIGKKYCNGVSNVLELEERGCRVFHGVDAKEMSNHFFLKTQRFDRIVYNFPHVGFIYPENSHSQIQLCFLSRQLFHISNLYAFFSFC